MNLALTHTHERLFSLQKAVTVIQLGLYMIRGDNVAVVGEIDEDLDNTVDYVNLRAAPVPIIIH